MNNNTKMKIKKILRGLLYVLGGFLAVVLILLIVLLARGPGKPVPIKGPDGEVLPGSISRIESLVIGDIEQYLVIRGQDSTNPVMLFLHGGPGSPETALMRHYNPDIEEDFVMVYWEQRGAGKSFSSGIPAESMTMERMIADTREVSEYLLRRFGRKRIFLMGHSWGSLLGMLAAHDHPAYYYAFFGVGQVAHQFRAERISYDWVLQQAHERGDSKGIRKLSAMAFPDSLASNDAWIDFIRKERNYVTLYGGALHGESSIGPMIRVIMTAREYSLIDKVNYLRGMLFSLDKLWPAVIHTNLVHAIDSMQVPVVILQGIHDYQTPYAVARDFHDQLKAPQKAFFRFEYSAHSPLWEETGKFNAIVRDRAKVFLTGE